MSRAVAVFKVRHRGIAIAVRVLPTVADVDAAYRGGRPRRDGDDIVHAYYLAERRRNARRRIVLPANGRLLDLVAHEVVHAVINGACHVDEETLADAVGVLCAAIHGELIDRGIEVLP